MFPDPGLNRVNYHGIFTAMILTNIEIKRACYLCARVQFECVSEDRKSVKRNHKKHSKKESRQYLLQVGN